MPQDDNFNYVFPAEALNTLARKQMQQHLLKDILIDLQICDLEGWDKSEYIKEVKELINSIEI